MALWSNTDASTSPPKEWNPANHPGASLVFVDQTEAANPTNRARGIKTPGWNIVREYLDSNGMQRFNVEPLVALSVPETTSGDAADDSVVPNVPVTITITTQPVAQSTFEGIAAFSVEAEVAPEGTLAYQWQVKKPGTSAYVALVGEVSDALYLSEMSDADSGTQYRCIVSSAGAKSVTSTAAKLTFVD